MTNGPILSSTKPDLEAPLMEYAGDGNNNLFYLAVIRLPHLPWASLDLLQLFSWWSPRDSRGWVWARKGEEDLGVCGCCHVSLKNQPPQNPTPNCPWFFLEPPLTPNYQGWQEPKEVQQAAIAHVQPLAFCPAAVARQSSFSCISPGPTLMDHVLNGTL